MENFLTYLAIFIAALLVMVLVINLGFRVKAKITSPHIETGPAPAASALSLDLLPAPVQRYLKLLSPSAAPESLAAWGRGRMTVSRLPFLGTLWTPMSWTIYLQPGQGFVWRTRFYWYTRKVTSGGEEIRQGKSRFMLGGRTVSSENLNHSETTMLWLYSLFFTPQCVAADRRVSWQAVDENNARLLAPYLENAAMEFDLTFDEASGQLLRVSTTRKANRDGTDLPFAVEFSGQRSATGINYLPVRLRALWENEAYLELETVEVAYHADVSQAMQEGIDIYAPEPPLEKQEEQDTP